VFVLILIPMSILTIDVKLSNAKRRHRRRTRNRKSVTLLDAHRPLRRLHAGAYLEAPRWHGGRLWLVDSMARQVVSIGPDGTSDVFCALKHVPSGMGFCPDGRLVVANMFKREIIEVGPGGAAPFHGLGDVALGTLDDMVVDRLGRIYVGDLGFNLHREPQRAGCGRILLLDGDKPPQVVAQSLNFPNGIAICPYNELLAVAETDANCVAVFRIGADGTLAPLRRISGMRAPDGICFDRSQALWVSAFDDDAFIRFGADGTRLDTIPVEGRRAVACCLGGASLDTLFLVSAQTTTSDLAQGRSTAFVDCTTAPMAGGGVP